MGRINNDAAFFMSYVRGEDRGQVALLPAATEDYVAADATVRVIDAFVDGLDVRGLGFGRSVPAATGRPPYDPRDLGVTKQTSEPKCRQTRPTRMIANVGRDEERFWRYCPRRFRDP